MHRFVEGEAAYRELVRPRLVELLELLHLDVAYERASGCWLETSPAHGRVLDLVCGYGTLLFGHNHRALVAAAVDHLKSRAPIHVQGSLRGATGELARRLSFGRFHVVFANSGAEAVEAALKHVLLERRGPIVALEGAFHGKTLGALQLTANESYRKGFELGLEVVRVPPNDLDALRAAFTRRPAALFLELIQGEGGVVPLTPGFVALARELCTDAALVVDECQTGLGRTGRLLACEHFGLVPDYVILSKVLGGGIAKISALLIDAARYRPEFGLLHTSTYAEDELSSAVALKVLDLLDEATLRKAARLGDWLKGELQKLRADFPDVVADVRGRGLMLGIEFHRPRSGFVLPLLGEELGLVVAGWLFHHHRIRVAPTLSQPFTLRVQPALVTPRRELARFVAALREACELLRRGDALALTRYFLPARRSTSDTATPDAVGGGFVALARDSGDAMARAGWLFHLADADDLPLLEPGFAGLTSEEREEYLRHVERRTPPLFMSSADVTSATGARVRFDAILLPITSRRIRDLLDAGEHRWLRRRVEGGIDVAEALGVDVVSLGQYTSIALANGLAARPRPFGITSGNACTVALALAALEREVLDLDDLSVAVVGAAGNIGATVSRLLDERRREQRSGRWRQLTLIGRDRAGGCARTIARLAELGIEGARLSVDARDVAGADLVVVAVSSSCPTVDPELLAPGALILDLSVPRGVLPSARTDLRWIRGGIARLPCGESLAIPSFPLPAGFAYACMVEAMLLALEGRRDRAFTGAVTPANVRTIAALAEKHGFTLAESSLPAARGALHAHV